MISWRHKHIDDLPHTRDSSVCSVDLFLVDFVVLIVLYLCSHPFVLLILLYLCVVSFSCIVSFMMFILFSLFLLHYPHFVLCSWL